MKRNSNNANSSSSYGKNKHNDISEQQKQQQLDSKAPTPTLRAISVSVAADVLALDGAVVDEWIGGSSTQRTVDSVGARKQGSTIIPKSKHVVDEESFDDSKERYNHSTIRSVAAKEVKQ